MTARYDAIVVGLGAMGSSAAFHLASRGQRVLGLEAFGRAHGLGSSGGLSRIIRLAYFEHPDYVPLLREAWRLWRELEAQSGEELLLQTGGLYIGQAGSEVLDGAIRSAREHGLPHEILDAAETMRRFPAFRLDPGIAALHEPMAGVLFPERVIETHLRMAERSGAEIHFDERVSGWGPAPGREPAPGSAPADGAIEVRTDHGTYFGDRLILAAGAWLTQLVPDLGLPLSVERNPLFWFQPVAPELFAPERLPVYLVDTGDETFYGFPMLPGQGAKVARHHDGTPTDPDQLDREVHPADEAPVRRFLEHYLPDANGPTLDARVCMYTNTPDSDFIIDLHPGDPRVVICSPCSGHGFKFSSVVGSIAADLAIDGTTKLPIEFLSLRRFRTA